MYRSENIVSLQDLKKEEKSSKSVQRGVNPGASNKTENKLIQKNWNLKWAHTIRNSLGIYEPHKFLVL